MARSGKGINKLGNKNNIAAQLNKLTKRVETLIETNKCCDSSNDPDVTGNFKQYRDINSNIKLNVDGTVFSSSRGELRRYPETRLGKLAKSSSISEILQFCDAYEASTDEFYFKKRSTNFSDLLEFYRTGSLHISSGQCKIAFNKDLEYWEISPSYLQSCCANKLADAHEALEKNWDYTEKNRDQEDLFPSGSVGRMKKKVWILFENPYSSMMAGLVSFVSMTFILLSIIILTINTFPKFQNCDEKYKLLGDYYVFAIIEAICISWFAFEFIVRFSSCPSKTVFLKQFMNWIDILVIFPYIIILVSHAMPDDFGEASSSIIDFRYVSQTIRLLRIIKPLRFMARIFKFARHSTGMVALGRTLKAKYKELSLILLFLGMGTIIFASMAFIAEVEDQVENLEDTSKIEDTSQIRNMPDAYWWAIVTMTTVGYGDLTPKTMIGKAIGTICPIFGILVVIFPIQLIYNTFDVFYVQEKRRTRFLATTSQDKYGLCPTFFNVFKKFGLSRPVVTSPPKLKKIYH